MRRPSRKLRNLTERFGVTAFIPPAHIEQIADERVSCLVHTFVMMGARADHLAILARSCYMQGLNDMTDAVVRSGQFSEKKEGE